MRLALVALLVGLGAQGAAAQRLQALVVTGLSGEPQYAARFAAEAGALVDAARQWGVDSSSLVYLAERPSTDPSRIGGRATREAVLAAIGSLAARAKPDGVVLIVLLGHGSQQSDEPKLSLPGPDLTAADLGQAIAAFPTQTLVVVNAASASGDFVKALSGKRRVIITATKTGFERNATIFAEPFVQALVGDVGDTDKDGRISVAEAFRYARSEVARRYQADRRLLTEHALLDDNGDGVGSQDLETGPDGALAQAIVLGGGDAAPPSDPRMAALVAERRRLEGAIAALRQRRASLDSAAYQTELERLLLDLARTNQALRALEAGRP